MFNIKKLPGRNVGTVEELFISKRIKQIRLDKEWTLEELAKRTGFTKGLLSKVENNKVSPPLSTLVKITRALDVSLSDLFKAADTRQIKIRRCQQKNRSESLDASGGRVEILIEEFPGQKFEPVKITIEDPNHYESKIYSHPGQEFIYVLTGKMKYLYGEEEYLVEAGDSLYFNAETPHSPAPLPGEKVSYLSILGV